MSRPWVHRTLTVFALLLLSCGQGSSGTMQLADADVGLGEAGASDGSPEGDARDVQRIEQRDLVEGGLTEPPSVVDRLGGVRVWGLDDFQISGLMLVFVLLLGVLVYAAMRWSRTKLNNLAMTKPRRALFNRVRPLVEAVATILYVVLSVRLVLGSNPFFSTVVLGLFTVGFIWISWFAIRDVVAGMLLKASEICLPGDMIEVGETVGLVRSLGYRVIAIDTPDGGQAFIPYTRISQETLVRKPVTDGVFRHNFQLQLKEDVAIVEAKAAIRRYALNSHWHSVVREPKIEVDDTNMFTVTVFALADNQGHRIEASVRSALEEAPPAGVRSPVSRV